MQKVGEEFMKKYGDDPRENVRCRLRMLETIEKARKMLSGDTESSINIEYLLNEEDLVRKMQREEFEQLVDPQMRQLSGLLRETIQSSGKFKNFSQLRVDGGLCYDDVRLLQSLWQTWVF